MSLPINIEELISGNIVESDRIEYKAGWNPEKILRTICAFANDFNNIGGGYIIVGIEEKHGVMTLPPKGVHENQIDTIQKELLGICHNVTPNYFPLVSVELFKEKQLLVFWAPAGDMRPYKAPKVLEKNSEKFYYIRRMTSSVQAKSADITRLFELAAKTPYDNRVNQNYSIDNFNLTTITTF